MVFQTRAGFSLLMYLQRILFAGQALPAFMNTGLYNRMIGRVVHNARDRVPLCSCLQITVDDMARSFGQAVMTD